MTEDIRSCNDYVMNTKTYTAKSLRRLSFTNLRNLHSEDAGLSENELDAVWLEIKRRRVNH